MAPDEKPEEAADAKSKQQPAADTRAAEAALKARLSRKRTKTGCLTCRKRRIKCGEERPVCKNCIKSKRHCEGYIQRVVFKPPTFDYRPAPLGGAHITFQAGPVPGPAVPFETPEIQHYHTDATVYSQLRPRPAEQHAPTFHQPAKAYYGPEQQYQQPTTVQYIPEPAPYAPAQPPQAQTYAKSAPGASAESLYPMSLPQSFQPGQYTNYVQRQLHANGDNRQLTQVLQYPDQSQNYASVDIGNEYATEPVQYRDRTQHESTANGDKGTTTQQPQYSMYQWQDNGDRQPASHQPQYISHVQQHLYVNGGDQSMRLPQQYYDQAVNEDVQQTASFQITPPVDNADAYSQPLSQAQQLQGSFPDDPWPASEAEAHKPPGPENMSLVSTRSFLMSQVPAAQPSIQTWATTEAYVPRPELIRPIDYQALPAAMTQIQQEPSLVTAQGSQLTDQAVPDMYEYETHIPSNATPTQMLIDAAVEAQDDDYYDVLSDEEMDFGNPGASPSGSERQRSLLSRMLPIDQFTTQGLQVRRYDTFLFEGMLDHYRVEQVANPLRCPATARVFAHFISVTGPSLSIFERHPRNTDFLFSDTSVPFVQQGLWTYTMPMAALHHQGLLHAMLALASLHIARLQNASMSPSMQHYAWALRRIHKCVSNRSKRLRVTTIAASMLLGFYEIIVADHMKWNTHLAGAKQLFLETDFAGMTQQFRRMKMDKAARDQLSGRRDSRTGHVRHQDDVLDQILDIDERFVSLLVGKEVRYGHHGSIVNPDSAGELPAELDLNKFEILKDLFWWYCKQDTYQSIVSGNPLLMEYSRWADCPPRAPLSRADAVYGSFDHLILLLARIADFGAKDRLRKLKQMEQNGGQWIPAAGMNIPRPPQAGPPPTPASATHRPNPATGPPPNSGPMFFGMAPPPPSNARMPTPYGPSQTPPTPQSARPHDSIDLHVATQNAMEEYGRIRAALLKFAASLGPEFQPLTSEYQPPMETPFGSALFYRSYDIGCLWAVYNMAVIIAIRSHPHMHPAAHAAAAITAHETAFFANEIGRISAGIVPGPTNQPLNPTLGAALCESCVPSFFAAVQYTDAEQRHATVMRIFGVALRTGWGSAELIANGCETSWVKAGQAGRGPPYQRVVRPQHSDDPRLNGSWERLDPNAMPDEKDEGDRRLVHMKANARLHWALGVMGTEADVAQVNGTT